MSRYIDAHKIEYIHHRNFGYMAFKSQINHIPTADVEKIIHSHWIKDAFCTTGDPYYTCANCGRFVRILYPNCPWCRAVMDADRTLEVDKAIQEIEMLEDLMEGEEN